MSVISRNLALLMFVHAYHVIYKSARETVHLFLLDLSVSDKYTDLTLIEYHVYIYVFLIYNWTDFCVIDNSFQYDINTCWNFSTQSLNKNVFLIITKVLSIHLYRCIDLIWYKPIADMIFTAFNILRNLKIKLHISNAITKVWIKFQNLNQIQYLNKMFWTFKCFQNTKCVSQEN